MLKTLQRLEEWAPVPAGKGRVRFDRAATADEALGQAYRSLNDLKADLDAMEEIPKFLASYYDLIMKAASAVGDARKDTYQLREVTKRVANKDFVG